jgi:hypothetical protein
MEKRYKQHHAVQAGDIVSLQVDRNERSHATPREIVGIAFNPTEHGSAKVATQWGIISAGRHHQVFPVASDKLTVKPDLSTISTELQEIRKLIQEGTFQSESYPKITVSGAHKKMLGHDSVPRGKCGCNRKKGCTGNCGCIRRGIPCTSSCGCFGNCSNPSN